MCFGMLSWCPNGVSVLLTNVQQGTDVLPYAIFLVVPVLGGMSDSLPAVRQVRSQMCAICACGDLRRRAQQSSFVTCAALFSMAIGSSLASLAGQTSFCTSSWVCYLLEGSRSWRRLHLTHGLLALLFGWFTDYSKRQRHISAQSTVQRRGWASWLHSHLSLVMKRF